jgi:hypothetical protein
MTRDTSRHEVGAPDDGPRPPSASGTHQDRGSVPEDPRSRGIPYEAQVFGRMAAFGLVVGAVYWFLTYETAGSVLLFTFGIASAVAAVAIFLGSRGRPTAEGPAPAASPSTLPVEPVPEPGWAPLLVALGLGAVALGGALGPWLTIAGLLLTVRAAWGWLHAAVEEARPSMGGTPQADQIED